MNIIEDLGLLPCDQSKTNVAGIYRIISPINKIYVGKAFNIRVRWRQHYYSRTKNNRDIEKSFYEFGFENHKFEILVALNDDYTESELAKYEDDCVEYYRKMDDVSLNMIRASAPKGDRPRSNQYIKLEPRLEYCIQNILTNKKSYINDLKSFCSQTQLNIDKLCDTLYGYTLAGQPYNLHKNYKLIYKKFTRDEYENDNLQSKIIEESLRRFGNRMVDVDTNLYQYDILNLKTNDKQIVINIDEFLLTLPKKSRYRLMDSLYCYDKDGCKIKNVFGYKIVSKKLLNNIDGDIKMQQDISDETIRRKNILKDVVNKKIVRDKFYKMAQQGMINYIIEDINTYEKIPTSKIRDFLIEKNLPLTCKLGDTIYGLDPSSTKCTQVCGYRIISKTCKDVELNIELQEHIEKVRNERLKVYQQICDKIKYRYKILNTITNDIEIIYSLADFCKKHDGFTHEGMRQTLQRKKYIYKGYKVLEKIVIKK